MMHEAANLRDTANQRPAKRGRVPSAKKLVKQEEELQQVRHTAAFLCKVKSPRMLPEIAVLASYPGVEQGNKEPWLTYLDQQGTTITACK
jgi:hypothetical protein